jgi:hypothetical protein
MPYQQSSRLPAEHASHLGHLEVLNSELVKKLCESFENSDEANDLNFQWEQIPTIGDVLPLVFGVDGSLQPIQSNTKPRKALTFVKTALIRLDQIALSEIDQETPHPYALRDILRESALYHATVLPLKHVNIPNMNLYDTARKTIFESLKDASLQGQPMETLKWLAYEKWDGHARPLPQFSCPHCDKRVATLPYDAEIGKCPKCDGEIFLTDMLGFHQDMEDDSASPSIANSYMSIHETLLLFTGIRYFWEANRQTLNKCLFVKDGPLSLRAQYSKLVGPIRNFLSFAEKQGSAICIIGQEKSGTFFDHLELIGHEMPDGTVFIPNDAYIKKEIQHRPDRGVLYGDETNYGAKVFIKLNSYHKMILNVPTGQLNPNPTIDDLIGAKDIFATLPTILSNRYEGALLPIELAHGVASLSTYPSAKILHIFAETAVKKVPYQQRFPGM